MISAMTLQMVGSSWPRVCGWIHRASPRQGSSEAAGYKTDHVIDCHRKDLTHDWICQACLEVNTQAVRDHPLRCRSVLDISVCQRVLAALTRVWSPMNVDHDGGFPTYPHHNGEG
jgi:hypothetical protein